jgi:hypothetical protein
MLNIKGRFTNYGPILEKSKLVNWQPRINAIVVNKTTMEETKLSVDFLIDTGASMTILHSGLKDLFEGTKHVDILKMNYGDRIIKNLKVYDTIIKIKGVEFNILAALDEDFKFPYSLLGITRGLDIFNHTAFNFKKKKYLLNKK